MHIRARKLIGIFACLAMLVFYCLLAMAIGAQFLVDAPYWLQLVGFILAGFLWLPPVMAIIRWMSRP